MVKYTKEFKKTLKECNIAERNALTEDEFYYLKGNFTKKEVDGLRKATTNEDWKAIKREIHRRMESEGDIKEALGKELSRALENKQGTPRVSTSNNRKFVAAPITCILSHTLSPILICALLK